MAPKMDVDQSDASVYLTRQLSSPSLPHELKPFYQAFERFYNNKLWYQLTSTIENFLQVPSSGPYQIELWESFVSTFAQRINQLKLITIGISTARQFSDGTQGLDFLTRLAGKVDTPETREAYVLATMEAAYFKLLLGDNEGTKSAIDTCAKVLDAMDSVDLVVHASYYRVAGDYYKAKAEYADYYKNSLLYLACVTVDKDLTLPERVQRAHDLAISALLGKIYNFGELLMHPILDSLNGTEYAPIKNLLFAFNAGDIGQFESLSHAIAQEPILQENYSTLRQKICLMALIEAVFRRPTSERVLPFSVIAADTRLPIDEVEHLVMKALSLKLIRGTLDQVSSTTSISWVQPRVLDKVQIAGLRDRLAGWTDQVTSVGEFTQSQAPELFAQ
ncbi:26S proteasome regulatory subunit N9 [Microbotryum lychnidis-dioicae p1A1 Lamole]|uniref:26S proteasome regulatory subunit N9 n=1 Tax=Microbotryum lychnidis-dioicae (strain p1A1 Lamole / MvSl-1064) TaxID=683840 RepID=U5H6S9_USTV1|nr:26S proteasome regulatory subunit N9 [Microbotryum lychnidis-dioicae p1A1 Lamole]|eukprot:KDE06781.1 26S proteasome regulatory subunit N9 [Microbotryum lychnidis-dioicae p1A1 Lamole]